MKTNTFSKSKKSTDAELGATIRIDMRSPEEIAGEASNVPDKVLKTDTLQVDEKVSERLTEKPSEKYRFRKSIARGGMKMVIQVKDMDTMRDVAMAVLPDAVARPKEDVNKFIREARITASLEHPNIVPVHDIGIDASGAPYFTMKLLRGETLGSVLERMKSSGGNDRQYNLMNLLRIFLKICNGVAFAHSKGVLHLDLKPANVQLGDFGEVIIMDWGLARLKGENVPEESGSDVSRTNPLLTMDGITKGTPGYMAPEQAAGKNSTTDERTDIYSLGAILYAMATLDDPIAKTLNVKSMLLDTMRGNILPPHVKAPEREIPAALEAVIRKAMSLKPSDRYSSVNELRNEVNAFINGFATAAEKASLAKRFFLMLKRHAIISSLVSIIVLLLVSLGIYAVQEQSRKKGGWSTPFACTFNDTLFTPEGKSSLKELIFTSADGSECPPWQIRKNNSIPGLVMPETGWMWLKYPVTEASKLSVTFAPKDDESAIEVFFAPDRKQSAPGYVIVAKRGSFAIYKQYPNGQRRRITHGLGPQSDVMEFSVRRNGENFIVEAAKTGEMIFANDMYPPGGEKQDKAGIHLASGGGSLISVSLSVQAIPERPSPLIAADALCEAGLFEKAVEKYLSTAHAMKSQKLRDEAIMNAYVTCATKGQYIPERDELLMKIKKEIVAEDNFLEMSGIKKMDTIMTWGNCNYETALRMADEICETTKSPEILFTILAMPRMPLPYRDGQKLLYLIATYAKDTKSLDVSDLDLKSIEPLAGMKLEFLDCSGNHLDESSMRAVTDEMPLRKLVFKSEPLPEGNAEK